MNYEFEAKVMIFCFYATCTKTLIVTIVLLLRQFQVLQGLGLYVDGEVPALVVADRNPAEAHFPAVEVAVDVDGSVGKSVIGEVPTRVEGDFPFRRDADITVDAQRLHRLVGGDAQNPGVGQRRGITQVVAETQRPRRGPVDVGIRIAHDVEQFAVGDIWRIGGAVGNVRIEIRCIGLLFPPLVNRALVERITDAEIPSRIVFVKKAMVFNDFKTVDASSVLIGGVWVPNAAILDV